MGFAQIPFCIQCEATDHGGTPPQAPPWAEPGDPGVGVGMTGAPEGERPAVGPGIAATRGIRNRGGPRGGAYLEAMPSFSPRKVSSTVTPFGSSMNNWLRLKSGMWFSFTGMRSSWNLRFIPPMSFARNAM